MSQIADYNVANASGAAVRSDINNIFLAVASANSGTSEPSTMYPFMIWVDTTNDLVKLRNGANDAWLTLPYSMTASNTVDINGGTVDGTTIGSSSASTIVGTTVVANTSLNIASDGATVTGIKDEDDMSSNSAVKLATQQSIKAYVDSQVDTVDTLGEVLAIGNTTGGTDLAVSANDDITFTDSSKAIFGASSDLSIYHDGSNSYVDEQGTGNLYLKGSDSVRFLSSAGEDMVVARTDGAVELYHNNTLKLSTSTLGVNIGNTSTGFHSSVHPLIVGSGSGDEGMAIFSGSSNKGKIGFADAASDDSGSYRGYFQYDHAADGLNIGTAGSTVMTIDASGNVGIGVTDPDSTIDISGGSNKLGILRLTQRASGAAAYGLDMGLDPSSGDPVFSRIVSDAVSEVFRIQRSSGNIGIGTSSPATLMNIKGATAGSGKLLIESGTLTNNNQAALFMAASNVNGHSGNVSIECNHPNNQQSDLVIRTGATDSTSYGTERFRITTDGNVGIGNSSPSADTGVARFLQIGSSSDAHSGLVLEDNSGQWEFQNNGTLSFFYDGSQKMALTTAGNLLVGCSDLPTGSVSGFGFTADQFYTSTTGTGANTQVRFYNGNGLVGNITTDGSATAYNTSSDARLKDVSGEARGLEVINALNPVAFNWKADNTEDEGLLAQEVMEIVPNSVSQGEDEYYQMDYSKLVTPLIKAIQELSAEVEQLKQQAHEKCEN
tara:strand:+ start:6310 stop:8469 length:2160 start_codon:yes stop_codon:yes gene_type:complete